MKVPSPGESISEVEILDWLVQDGDYVEKDQSIAEIDSDKATLELPAEERQRRWNQLAAMYMAQQLGHYPPTYVQSEPNNERQLETVEKFEEDLTDVSRIHRPMSVTVKIGPAIPIATKRDRKASEDPVMVAIEQQLHQLLGLPYKDREAQE